MELARIISRNLRALRERTGLSQRELADRTGISTRYISQLETGAPNLTVDIIDKLAKGLNCPAHELVHDSRIKASAGAVQALNEAIRLLTSLRTLLRPQK